MAEEARASTIFYKTVFYTSCSRIGIEPTYKNIAQMEDEFKIFDIVQPCGKLDTEI